MGATSEDCLFLNIVTPAVEGGHRPVLFWIHGGAFVMGSANEYDGSMLAAQGDVVVVAINYRLGLFGFLDLSPLGEEFAGSASNGLRDQVLALEWVRDNIADYGGDPGNVTIFGESAGGQSVHALLATPAADGLYQKAIAHSPGTVNLPPKDQVGPLLAHLGGSRERLVDALRALSTTVGEAGHRARRWGGGRDRCHTLNQRRHHGAGRASPLIAGSNRDEGTLFTALLAMYDPNAQTGPRACPYAHGRRGPRCRTSMPGPHPDADAIERAHLGCHVPQGGDGQYRAGDGRGPGGWLYQFDLPTSVKWHGHELGANVPRSRSPSTVTTVTTPERRDSTTPKIRRRDLLNVSRRDRPRSANGAGLPHWPRYDAQSRRPWS